MTKRDFLTLSLGMGALLLATQHAFANGAPCARRDLVIERLTQTYGETRRSVGLGAGNQVVETFASADTGSWTITITRPDGITCMVAAGEAFEPIAPMAPAAGQGA